MPNTTIKRRLKPRPKALWVLAGLGKDAVKLPDSLPLKIKREISNGRSVIVRQSKRAAEHARNVAKWKPGKKCRRCDYSRHIQCHHSRGKLGSLLTDERFWIPLCFCCHRWVHDNPDAARAKGLLCERGLWNVPER